MLFSLFISVYCEGAVQCVESSDVFVYVYIIFAHSSDEVNAQCGLNMLYIRLDNMFDIHIFNSSILLYLVNSGSF